MAGSLKVRNPCPRHIPRRSSNPPTPLLQRGEGGAVSVVERSRGRGRREGVICRCDRWRESFLINTTVLEKVCMLLLYVFYQHWSPLDPLRSFREKRAPSADPPIGAGSGKADKPDSAGFFMANGVRFGQNLAWPEGL